MIASLSWRAWLRQMAAAPAVPIALAVATLVTVVSVSITPRILDHASVHDLRDEVTGATAEQRNISFGRSTRLGVSQTSDPLTTIRRTGEQLLEEVPASVSTIIDSQRFVIDTPRFQVTSYPDEDPGPFPTTLELRHQEAISAHMTLLEGEMPRSQPVRFLLRGRECPSGVTVEEWRLEPDRDIDCGVVTAPVFDTVISPETAAAMRLDVADEVILFPDPMDLRWRRATGQQFGRRFIVRISGIVEFADPGLEYWYGDTSLHRPRITENADYRLIYAVGHLDADLYEDFLRATISVPLTYTWRNTVDVEQILPERAAELANDLERPGPPGVDVRTRLPILLRNFLEQRSVAIGVMSVLVSGLFAITAGGLTALAIVGAIRHAPTTTVVLQRGARRRHLVADGARAAAVAVVPAALAGWLAGALTFPDTPGHLPAILAVIAAAAATVVTVGARAIGRGRDTRSRRPDFRRAPWRAVVELFTLVAAAGIVVVLRRRGAITDVDHLRDIDPLLSIAGAVVAFAAAIVGARVTAPLLAALALAGAYGRGVTAFVGARLGAQQARIMAGPLVVVIAAVAIACFATTVGLSIERTQQARSWSQVGGDYRIESRNRALPLSAVTDRSRFADDRPIAPALILDTVSVLGRSGGGFAGLSALSLGDYLATVVDRGDGLDFAPLEALRASTVEWDRESGEPIPALVSSRWPASTALRPGETFTMDLGSTRGSNFSVLALVDRVPGVDPDRPFVVVDLDALRTRLSSRAAEANVVIGRASRSTVELLARDFASDAAVVVRSRYDVLDAVGGDPMSVWVRRGLVAVVVLGGLVATLAAVAAFEITAAARDRDLSVLRTLGLRRRQAVSIAVTEQAPSLAIAVGLGTAAGLAIAWLLHPALRLGRLADADSAVAPAIDVGRLAAVAGAVAAAMIIAIGIWVWRLVRRNDGSMLRTGDQP